MKNKFTLCIFLVLSLFLFNSCELLNPLFESKSKTLPDNFQISIERTHGTIQGQAESVEILLHNNTLENYELGSFEIMIAYDPTVLIFQSVEEGSFLTNCAWEYFTVQHEIIETDTTDIYAVRIFSYADLYPPIQTPLCFTPTDSSSNQLVVLNFLVTNDRNYECTFTPIQFFWEDCGDNTISDYTGNQLFMSRNIYNKLDTRRIDDTQNLAKDIPFPSFSGYNSSCDPHVEERGGVTRNIDFINGGIDIAGGCMYPAARGDINLNEIQYELADAVMYSNYFVHGESVFTKDIEKQIAQTDVDADGVTLTVADLTYLIRVLIGDANPYPKEAITEQSTIEARYEITDNGNIAVLGDIKISAVHIIVENDVTPVLLADNMSMAYHFDGDVTRILIMSLANNSFSGQFVNLDDNDIVSIAMADNYSNQVIITEVR